jgi:hypothetical protein
MDTPSLTPVQRLLFAESWFLGHLVWIVLAAGDPVMWWDGSRRKIAGTARRHALVGPHAPRGTCGRRERHEPHAQVSATLGTFWCSGDPRAFGIAWNERVR